MPIALSESGHQVIASTGDADTQIVGAALDVAWRKENVTEFVEDTDMLLVYFWNSDMGLFMTSKAKKYQTKKLLNTRKVANDLSPVLVKKPAICS